MRTLQTTTHPDVLPLEDKSVFHRLASRAIVVRGDNILLLFTERYHDYSLPGGGVDPDENDVDGLIRELKEETGAQNIRNIRAFGAYEEFRPWHKGDYDVVHMVSKCFWCDIDEELGEVSLEDYEVKNGMRPVWVNIREAIAHNKETMAKSDKQGLSVVRETFLLELIANAIE
ncbi:DNA mismatch repair protein MutT [Enterovibrio norvegicus FF-33]|uniref:DNA mismatch repair protein MutT n=1 Tax=Enterovibrio norvegicus FF-454 TaxID=1185651 RepID=A0A1E5CBY8_9GAMM|nr:NUDIX hydrolase [Enterovibrio norvegicus]OEE62965.1 DNA mismatch repair protein MutT [Enterovibrio norvegicus FF-454]OEE66889.1 DNA mismatch repair protein MutT [Enterovibrio norvegicus FF-33]OEE77303.1 DNA mismatch repair protein MutT [Enterovibrio norvegicus FF-162]